MKINDLSLYSGYAFRDLSRSYSKILSIIITLLISLFILSAILTIEESFSTVSQMVEFSTMISTTKKKK